LELLEHAEEHSLGSAALRHRVRGWRNGGSPIRYSADHRHNHILGGGSGRAIEMVQIGSSRNIGITAMLILEFAKGNMEPGGNPRLGPTARSNCFLLTKLYFHNYFYFDRRWPCFAAPSEDK
jgi:hypothetical protein